MASETEKLHFLLVPLMSQGHIIPLTDFAKLLARWGVFVSIVTTPLNAVRYKDVIDHAKAQNLKIQMIPIKFPCQEAGLPEGCENLDELDSLELSWKFMRACDMLQAPLETLMEELEPKPSCIVSSNAILWTEEVCRKFKIPRYKFGTVSCFTSLCASNISQVDQESILSDSEPFLVPDIPHKIEFTKAQMPKHRSPAGKHSGGSEEHKHKPIMARDPGRATLVNSFAELEPGYLDGYRKKEGKVWCVGPVSLCNKELSERSARGNKASIDEHYCLTWLDSKKPKSVIFACFGSMCHISFPQIKEIGLGLEASNFPFIWIIRKQDYSAQVEKWLAEEGLQERVGERGLIIQGWAPQILILSHPSVGGFLTHCGWNSTLEAICAGVPMITWPMFAEQFFNEKLIVNVLGIGVRVGVERPMSSNGESEDLVRWDDVKRGIEKLMDVGSEEGRMRRKRGEELAKMASNAVEEGGSSYMSFTMLIQDVLEQLQ
ncbi:UDP-glycosyltransferase 73C5 [Sesamum alatum]|uniref:Glycosyltransferase n=1 Tax=Sesamum alatum TaxID=300844 RepID=A0AAE1YLK5_9LAMI|nr:UDP-glycosyltransferase 73C5 [Sesamum alatum]